MATTVSAPQIHSRVQEFIAKPRKMFIDGKWVEAASGKTFPTYNPATGEVMAQVAEGDREDINRAVKAARKAFDSGAWSEMPPASQRRRMSLEAGRSDRAATGGVRSTRGAWTTASRWPSHALPMCRWRSTCSATWRAGPTLQI